MNRQTTNFFHKQYEPVPDWLNNNKPGFIFVTNYSDIRDTLRPILSLFVDLMGRRLLSLSDDFNRRIYFMLDEFGTLQRLSTIVNLLTLSRSKGGCCWLGIQDIGQMDKLYKQHTRQTILNATGTSIMFNVADEVFAEMLSKRIGKTEVSHVEESHSMGPEDMRDGISMSRKDKVMDLAMASELMNLPDLTCYLKIPNLDVVKTKIEYNSYTSSHEAFELKDGLGIQPQQG